MQVLLHVHIGLQINSHLKGPHSSTVSYGSLARGGVKVGGGGSHLRFPSRAPGTRGR